MALPTCENLVGCQRYLVRVAKFLRISAVVVSRELLIGSDRAARMSASHAMRHSLAQAQTHVQYSAAARTTQMRATPQLPRHPSCALLQLTRAPFAIRFHAARPSAPTVPGAGDVAQVRGQGCVSRCSRGDARVFKCTSFWVRCETAMWQEKYLPSTLVMSYNMNRVISKKNSKLPAHSSL